MSRADDLTDAQSALLEAVFNAPGTRRPRHARNLRLLDERTDENLT
jgi:hypothetical protein